MREIIVPKVTKRSWSDGAYTIAFIYSNKGNFVLKGFSGDVRHYLKDLVKRDYKYFANFTYWQYGMCRNHWLFYKDHIYIFEPVLVGRMRKIPPYKSKFHYTVTNFTTVSKFKRLPNKWIADFERL